MDNLVKVAKVPGRTVEVAVSDNGLSVAEILRLGGFTDTDGFSIRVDGDAASKETVVQGGSTVILAKEIKGN